MCIIYKLRNIHITGVGAQHLFLLSRGTIRSVWTTPVWLTFKERGVAEASPHGTERVPDC